MSPRKNAKKCEKCTGSGSLSFHLFPPNGLSRQLWLKFCGIPSDTTKKFIYLCDKHFKRDDYYIVRIAFDGVPAKKLLKPECKLLQLCICSLFLNHFIF